MKRLFLAISLSLSFFLSLLAEERPTAVLKAQYNQTDKYGIMENGDTITKKNNFILQIAKGQSFFYDPQQYYVDSLLSDPKGRQIYDEISRKVLLMEGNLIDNLKSAGINGGSKLIVRKDFVSKQNEVWDSALNDIYQYLVPMDELIWEINDSTKIIMDYECQMATADYHGRKWEVWFSPEIPVQDGPWQLCGLPGLIMEAKTCDDLFTFQITGLQECQEPIKIPLQKENAYKSNRKAFRKVYQYVREHFAETLAAQTMGRVKPKAQNKIRYLQIETDFNE